MNRPGSVLLVSHYYAPHVGGIEAVVRAEAHALRERGLRVDVLTSACGASPGRGDDDGVTVNRVAAWNGLELRLGVPFPVFSPSLLLRAFAAVRRAELVHLHEYLYLSSWVVATLCRITRTPYVVTQHVGRVEHPSVVVRLAQGLVRRSVGRFVLGGARRVLPINPFIADDLRSLVGAGAAVHVLGNGVDTDAYRPAEPVERREIRQRWGLPADGPLVLFVGRFVPKKGFPDVVAAGSADYTIAFVGGDRPPEVAADDRHVFLGSREPDEVAELYRAADVYVGASVGECPLSVLEAMASGLPVVLNDDPGYHAIGADGPGVHYVDARGQGCLRERLELLVGDPVAVRDAGREARRTAVGAFSWTAHAEQLTQVYAEAVA